VHLFSNLGCITLRQPYLNYYFDPPTLCHCPADRVVRLLEQYQSRLHGSSHDGYEEELAYIKQILASPLFQQYLTGGLPQREKQEIVKASTDILNGIESNGSLVEDGPISPTEKRRRLIHRKQSLKALRNAVIPKSPSGPLQGKGPAPPPHYPMGNSAGQGGGQHQVMFSSSSDIPSSRYHSPGPESNGISEGIPLATITTAASATSSSSSTSIHEMKTMGPKSSSASRMDQHGVSPHTHISFSAMANGGMSHERMTDWIREDNGFSKPFPLPPPHCMSKLESPWAEPMNLAEARAKNLSSSSSMLLERPSPPKEHLGGGILPSAASSSSSSSGVATTGGRKISQEGFLGSKIQQQTAAGAMSGSQPNISHLHINQQGELEFIEDFSQEGGDLMPELGKERGSEGVALSEWNDQSGLVGGPGSVLQSAAPSGGGAPGKGAMKLVRPPVSPPTARPPPPYQFNHLVQDAEQGGTGPKSLSVAPPSYSSPLSNGGMKDRRTKSYERLLDIGNAPPSSYPNLTPLGGLMTQGNPTQDQPTAERRKTTLVVQLRKGKEGLGFRLKGLGKGELFIQDLQPGGVADR